LRSVSSSAGIRDTTRLFSTGWCRAGFSALQFLPPYDTWGNERKQRSLGARRANRFGSRLSHWADSLITPANKSAAIFFRLTAAWAFSRLCSGHLQVAILGCFGVRELAPAFAMPSVSLKQSIWRHCVNRKSGGEPPHSKMSAHRHSLSKYNSSNHVTHRGEKGSSQSAVESLQSKIFPCAAPAKAGISNSTGTESPGSNVRH